MPTSSGTQNLQAFVTGIGPVDLGSNIFGFYPPYVLDFFLDSDQYTESSSVAWADIVDYHYKIDKDSTYFVIDGTVVSGTFTTLSGVTASGVAYRMSYDPADDFGSFSGPTGFTVHVENELGGTAERTYRLVFGYKVDFDNDSHKYLDYGFYNKVVVRSSAENLATCTKESAYAYWFETRTRPFNELSCSIVGMNNVGNLSANIVPLTTAYYYGRECRLVVRAKDFSGNEMEDFVLEFKIEED